MKNNSTAEDGSTFGCSFISVKQMMCEFELVY